MTSPKSSSDHPGVGLSWHRCLGGAHNISTYSPESHHKCYHIIFPQIFPRTLLILITSQFSFPAFRGKNDMICKTWILFMIYCKGFWGDTWWGLERKQKRFQFCVHSKSTDFNFNSTCLQLNEINFTKNMKDICPAVWFPRLKAEPLKASNPWKHSMLYTGYTQDTQDTQCSTLDTCCIDIERWLWIIANETMLSTMYTLKERGLWCWFLKYRCLCSNYFHSWLEGMEDKIFSELLFPKLMNSFKGELFCQHLVKLIVTHASALETIN